MTMSSKNGGLAQASTCKYIAKNHWNQSKKNMLKDVYRDDDEVPKNYRNKGAVCIQRLCSVRNMVPYGPTSFIRFACYYCWMPSSSAFA